MKPVRFFIRAAIALGLFCNVAGFGNAPWVSAQTETACTVAQIYALKQQREAAAQSERFTQDSIRHNKSLMAEMDTQDPNVININLRFSRYLVDEALRLTPEERRKYAQTIDLDRDRLNFWLEKKREIEAPGLNGIIENTAGGLTKARIRSLLSRSEQNQQRAASRVEELDRQIERCQGNAAETKPCTTSIVGTWNWWNGLTVTFSQGGGASYRGSATGSGSWQHTGGNSYHAHWNAGNTNDYFTLSRDGTKIEGQFDGKPGTSTRKC